MSALRFTASDGDRQSAVPVRNLNAHLAEGIDEIVMRTFAQGFGITVHEGDFIRAKSGNGH
ncbi:hypothetical protein D3C76_1705890 [compost metagenome]